MSDSMGDEMRARLIAERDDLAVRLAAAERVILDRLAARLAAAERDRDEARNTLRAAAMDLMAGNLVAMCDRIEPWAATPERKAE